MKIIPGIRFRRATAALVGAAFLVGLAAVTVFALPEVEPLAHSHPQRTSYMRMRAKEVRLPQDAYRTEWVGLDSISPYVLCAIVKAEDRGYFRHRGFEWGQMRKAVWRTITRQSSMGGSTITQQTARNLFLTPERSLSRKLREALIARELEDKLNKERILEIYLNVIEWGDGIWGIRSASAFYFGKAPADLDPFEATFLSSLVAAPRQPLIGQYRGRAELVQRRVLGQMYRSGLLDEAQWRNARPRIDALHSSLAKGIALRSALQEESDPLFNPVLLPHRFNPLVIPAAEAIRAECGLAREIEESELSSGVADSRTSGGR